MNVIFTPRKKHIFISRIWTLVVMLLFMNVLLRAQTTHTVCASGCDHTTIQAAINGATAGDIVEVSAGTYTENVIINKSLTLNGANVNTSCGSRAAESTIAPVSGLPVNVTADGVTINGFEITAPDYQYAILCGDRSNLTISFNNINNIGTSITPTNVYAIQYTLGSGIVSNVTVSNNCFETISNSGLTGFSASAIGFLQSTSTGTLTNLTINGNTINNVNVNTAPWPTGKLAYGILVNIGGGSGFADNGKVNGLQIHGNEISNLEGFISTAIGLEGNTENATIENNIVSNLIGYKDGDRTGGGYDLQALKFENNRYVGTVTVSNNSFETGTFTHDGTANRGYAIANYVNTASYGQPDIDCNWYGTAVESEIEDLGGANYDGKVFSKVGAELEFIPYLVNNNLIMPSCIGGLPIENVTQGTFHATIQAAIDAANPDDVIEVPAGSYSEVLIVNKPLSLLGPNATISAVTGTRIAEAVLNERININAIEGVTISGFEFLNVVSANTWTIYIQGNSNNFTFENNRFINIEKDAIRSGITSSTGNVTVQGNLIDGVTGNLSTGILLGGIYGTSVIADNKIDLAVGGIPTGYAGIQTPSADGLTISGNEISNATNQGLQLAGTCGDVTIENNVITNTNTSDGADKGAIRIYGTDFTGAILISGNTLTSSFNGIAVKDGENIDGKDITLINNDLSGNSNFGAYNGASAGTLNASCNWWGTANLVDVDAAVSGDVNYLNYLVNSDIGNPDCSGVGSIVNASTGQSYLTIQDAVDASLAGHKIQMGSGTNNGSVDASGKDITLAPGSSPGCIEIVGDYTLDAMGTQEIEIDGKTVCTQYDQVEVTGIATLGGANLDLLLGFAPTLGDEFEILTSANPIVGQFAQGNSITASYMSTNYVFSIDYSANKVSLTACTGGVVNVTQSNKEYCSIQAAIDEANDNDVITVAAGTYVEDVNVNKANLTISGADATTTTVSGPAGGDGGTFRVAASGVTIEGFTITREGNNTTDWNNPTLNFAGVAIQGQTNNAIIRENIITGNRTGIDVNNSNGNQIIDNNINFNRTGLLFRNQTDNTVMTGNFITDNWTSGVLFIDASGGTNSPVQSAINSQFNNNNISGNWYGDIVERQVGGSLPAAGTTNLKNFECNWFGTTSPTVSTANSTEPGYAAQIPVAYGGMANNPGGAPNILGPASANFEFIPWGVDGTDNDTGAPGWQITPSTCTGQGPVKVYSDAALTTLVSSHLTIQAAIDAATTQNGYFVTVDAGTYFENVIVNKAVTIEGPQKDIDPRTAASARTAGSIAEAIVDGGGGSSPVFEITVAGVVLNGLEITNGSGDLVSSPSGAPVKENVFVKYCIVHNSTGDEGIQLRNVDNGGVEYCLVFDVAGDGINMCCGSTSSFVNFNEISGSGSNDASVYLYDNGPFMVVSNNLVYDNTADVGIMIGNKNGNDGNKNSSFTNNATVSNNSISGHTGSEVGLYVNTSRVIIMDNLITNWESTGDAALYLRYNIKDIEVSGNDISGNEHGIKISSGVSSTNATTLSIIENDLSGNTTFGIKNGSSGAVEANCNWFGTTVPSTIIAGIDGDVNFQPYLTSGGDSGANAPGFDPTGDCVGCLNGGLVTNTDTGKNFCSIQGAIDDVTTLNTHTIEIESGTYDEQILVNKSLSLIGVGLTNPIILFTGTVVGKPTLIDVSSPNVTIQELQLDVDLTKLSSGIIASATNVSGITIKDNVINATGSSAAASFGPYGNRNAVSINYGGSTNYRVASGGVSGITFEGNTVSSSIDAFSVGRIFRAGVCADEAGGTFTGNTIQSVNQDIQVRFGNNGAINIANNNLNGGGVDISDNNASAGTISITNNNFNSVFSNQFVTPRTAVLRLKNNQQNIETNITGNTFTDALWSISAENYRNVTIDNNIFSPPAAATDFVHIGVNTKSISSNSNSIVQTEVNGVITNNTFNGSGTLGGTAIGFFNHDSDNATFGNYSIGTAGNENEFGDLIGQYIRLDNQTGTTTGATNPTTYPGTGGWPTTMACWNQNYDIRNNLFNVGSGLQNTNSMSSVERATLESRLFHNPDASCVGSLTYFDPVTNITQNTSYLTISAAVAAANPGDEIELKEWEFNEKVIIDKSLTIQGVDKFNVILDGTGLGNARGIEILNGVTNVTIQNLTVQNYQGAGPNLFAGIYAVGGNDGLNIQNVNVFDNIGGTGIYANGPVDNVTINAATVSGHTNVAGAARGIVIWNGHKSNITITNCTVTDNNCCGIELQDGTASDVLIEGNLLSGNADNGIGVVGLMAGTGPSYIRDNFIDNCGRFGIEIKNPDGSGLETGSGAIIISGNEVTRPLSPAIADARDIAGIAVFRRGVLAGNVDVPTGVVVKNNTISGYKQPTNSTGFGIVAEGTNHTVYDNIIARCDIGFQVQVGHGPYPGDGDQNNLNDLYFGRGNSPETCQITDGDQFYGTGTSENTQDFRAVGFGDYEEDNKRGVTNTNTSKVYCSIQTAIDNVSTTDGHIITVSAAKYPESVTVTKEVDIRGARFGVPVNTRTFSDPTESFVEGPAAGSAFILGAGADGTSIKGFSIGSVTDAGIRGVNMTHSLSGVAISENFFDGFTTGLAVSLAAAASNTTVEGNDITNAYAGIYLSTGATGSVISRNLVHDLAPGTFDKGSGLVLEGNNTANTISENIFSNNDKGVYVWTGFGNNFSGTGINNNAFLNNTLAIQNTNSEQVNGTCNWFNTEDYVEIDALTSGNIVDVPYLTSGIDDDLISIGFQPEPLACGGEALVTNINKNTYFSTIKSAIEDAGTTSGDTLIVLAGTYSEFTDNTNITKSLVLLGPNEDKCFDDPTRLPEAIIQISGSGILTVNNSGADGLVIAGFKIDVNKTGGNAMNVSRSITIRNNIIEGNNSSTNVGYRFGIFNQGNADSKLFKCNKISGFGTGILFDGGNWTGITVEENEFSDNSVIGVHILSSLIGGVTVTGNVFENNGNGIIMANANNEINNNEFIGGGRGIYLWPEAATSNMLIQNNTFEEQTSVGLFIRNGSNTTTPFTNNGNVFQDNIFTSLPGVPYINNTTESFRLDVSDNIYDGADPQSMGLIELFDLEDKMIHVIDLVSPLNEAGFLRLKSNEVFVTQNSNSIARATLAAEVGDIIHVQAGSYQESVQVNKQLDIRGANYNTPVTGRTFAGSSESFVQTIAAGSAFTMQVGSAGTSIRGFSMGSVGDAGNRGVNMITGLSNITISENIISGFTPGLAVSVAAGSTNITVAENDITNVYAGIYLSANATNNFVLRNLIHDLTGSGLDQGSGIVLEGNNTNTSISQNVLTNNEHGVYVWTGFGSDFSGTTISDNSFTGNTLGINNTNAGNVVATCNWWGSTNFSLVSAAVTGDVTFSPYLEDGTDDDNASIGFQSVSGACSGSPVVITSAVQVAPITCGNTVSSILVSFNGGNTPFDISWDGTATGSTSNVTSPYEITNLPAGDYMITVTSGNSSSDMAGPVTIEYLPVHNSTLNTYHATIQAAIDGASTGNVIQICAGTYSENLVVDESVELRGPNYGINPNTGIRVAEAIVVPASIDALGDIISIEASDVTIDGLSINGDNTALISGWIGTNGADIDAGRAITVSVSNINDLVVSNNIIENVGYFGIFMFGAAASDANSSKTGHVISENLIRDLGHYNTGNGYDSWGGGMYLGNSHYTNVANNVIHNVRIGIQTGNFQTTHVGDPQYQVIENNIIQTRYLGIFYNLHRFSPLTITNNTITGIDNAVQAGLTTRPWRGILLGSLGNNMGASTISDNIVDGSGITLFTATGKEGINVWNVKNDSPANITGGNISGVGTGIFLNNFEGFNSNAGDGAHASISGVEINASDIGVKLLDSPSSTSNAAVVATITDNLIIGGVDGIKMEEGVSGTVSATLSENSITGTTGLAISAAAIANPVTASCNWYGIEDVFSIEALISGDVNFLPFLVEDNDFGIVNPSWSTDLFSCIGVGPVVVYNQDPTLPGTITVSSHMTIQAAIDAPTTLNGHYVAVSSGNYDELVVVNKEITVSGFGADNTLLQSSNPLATNILSIEANNVSVKDIAIVGAGGPTPLSRGVYMNTTLSGILIENVISVQHNYGIYVDAAADVTGLSITNTVLNNNGNGLQIEAQAKVDGLTIVDGEMNGNLFGLSAAATSTSYDNSEDLINVSITGTTFSNNTFFGLLFNKGKGVVLDGITVDGNGDVTGAPGAGVYFTWREGIYDDIQVINSSITNNGNNSGASAGAGILVRPRLNATVSDIQIRNNFITGNGFAGNGSAGIRILKNNDDAGTDPADVLVNENNISGNANHNISSTTVSDVIASCNWWGTNDGAAIALTVDGNVDFGPFLTAGGDSGSAAPGFSPTGTCDGCNGGTVTNVTLVPNKYYCSIQEAIDDPDTEDGHTIMVDAGVYVENIKVTKSLAILGPNDAVEACSGTRSTEAIIYPAVSDIDWDTADGTIIEILASDVTISGFTIDGDNPNIVTGKSSTNGADIDAAEGITRYGTGDNLVITNNIIQNVSYFAITMYDFPDAIASAGNIVSGNLIKDLGTYDGSVTLSYWGGGILMHNNQYISITDNCMENVRMGIQTGNFYRANPGAPSFQVIEGNTIQARRRGIFHNLAYSNASPITINNNTITGLLNVNETLWDGILLSSLSVPSTTSNNMVNGVGITNPSEGIEVWNVKNTSPAVISGGSISNVGTGLFLNNFEGYASNAGDGAHATVSDMTITPSEDGIGVRVLDSPSSTTHAKVNISLDDVIINGGLEGVKFEESQAGTVGGSITNNMISSDSIGINVTRAQTSATNSLAISGNTITNTSQQNAGGNSTIGILLTNLTGTAAATVINNDINGPFYGYVGYNINTTPATTISGGDITGIMQGVAVVNTVGGPLAPSTVNVSGTSMSGFAGTSTNPANNFHAGIYTFTANGTTTSNGLNLTVDNVSITGTGVPSQSSGGIYLADFSGGSDFVQMVTVENSTISDNANRGIDARGKVNLTLHANTISNNGFNAFGTGGNDGFSVIAQQDAEILATNNFITLPAVSTTKAFGLFTGNGSSNLITANDNSILFNGNATAGSKSANSSGTGTINAACNWWGVLCLEDIEALTNGNVNIPTWLINGMDDEAMTPGFQPVVGACLFNKPVVTVPAPVTVCSGNAISVTVGNMDDVPLVITKYDIEVMTPAGVTAGMSNATMPATDVVDFNYILNDEYSNVSGAVQTVTYIVTPYFSDCPGESYNIEVLINSEPVGSNTTVSAVCSDVAFDLNPQAYITNSVASSFTWTATYDSGLTGGAASGSGNVDGTLNNETDFVLNAYFTVTPTATLGGCVGASYMVVVPISPTPDVNDITVDVCSNEAMSLDLNDYVANNISVAFTWNLTTPNLFIEGLPTSGTSDDISSGLITNLATVFRTAVYTVQTTADVPGCAGNSFLLTVKVNPQPNVNMSSNGPLALCENETRVLGATGTNGAAPYTYHWSIAGTTGSVVANLSGQPSIVSASPTLGASGSGTVTVQVIAVDNFGCSSDPQQLTFDVGSAPAANAIVGPSSACQLTTTTYTVTNINPSATYTWTIFSGGVIVTSNVGSSIDATWVSALSGPHTVQVIEETVGGCSTVNTLAVTILPLPSSTSMSPIPVALVGDVANVTVNGLADGDYTIHYTLGADASTTANVTSSGGVAMFQTRALTAADEGATVAVTLIENNTTSCPQSVSYVRTISFLEEVVEVNIHMLLAGPHNAGMMNTTLNNLGYLPTDQPYTTAPFSYNGSETLATIPMTMVDWVLVRLRDKNDPTLIIATRAAILHNDGEVTDVDGVSPVEFTLVPDTEYYIEVNHRNHLGAMTLNPVTIDAMSLMTYDFRTDPTFGTNAQRLVSGNYMLWAGDGNQDGFISYNGPINDRISILTVVLLDPGNTSLSPNYTVSGYYNADLNMDGNVQNSGPTNDGLAVLTSVLLNPSNSMSSPGFVLIQQLP